MASDTKNVKIGVCKTYFDGVDLGYTKGGVEVSVTTDTYKVEVDQFGKTPINEYIMGRMLSVKVPLAESTLENMVAVMPGATLTQVGGTVASGTLTFATAPAVANDTVTVNGAVFTFKAVPANEYEVAPGATFTASAQNLLAALQASTDPRVAQATYSIAGAVITVKFGSELQYGTAGKQGVAGNAFTLAKSSANVTLSGATLTGGVDPTSTSISVATGVGTDLLSMARELRLHPQAKVDTDKSDDFVIPLAATPGALTFAYQLENERIYNVEFSGYPDATTGKLYSIGA